MSYLSFLIELLDDDPRVSFSDGLTDDEIQKTESKFGFQFPADLQELLQYRLPVGPKFPDWRNGPDDQLQEQLDIPIDGILFDVRRNRFWLPEWGERPDTFEETESIVRKLVADAPTLVPIYAHRMIPDRPHRPGNPVFSVHQTDIIYYGMDLRDYLLHEFVCKTNLGIWPMRTNAIRKIDFWDLERFATRWENGPVRFDNSNKSLP